MKTRITSIQGRLMATVVISQALLAVGLVVAGQYYTYRRLLSTLDANLEAHAMSVAALVRYTEDASGNVYFDNSMLPGPIDPERPDLFSVWTERSGLLTRSGSWPRGLELSPSGRSHWNFKWNRARYRGLRIRNHPVLDREEGAQFRPQSLSIVYAARTAQIEKQVQAAGIFIALISLGLLALTVRLALAGIRRGLVPLEELATRSALVSANHWQLDVPESVRRVQELEPLTNSMTMMLARLESSFSQQREFLGNAAHELKTPVAVLKSTLQSLEQKPRSSEQYRAGLQAALDDLARLEQLLNWMLRLARAEQWARGGPGRELETVDVARTCEEAVDRMRPLADSKRITLELEKNGPAPLPADPEDLHLVWVNLLENAVLHSGRGSSVRMSVSRRNGRARVVVTDQGEGIPPEDLPHIFERFYRSDRSRTRATGGFGLGLAIAKAIVEAYGGRIAAKSSPGQGTEITVELPVKKS
ncbi:MAG: HAMP domain-containing histidine kinase [Acidobacteria bacterium]|nr:HAMP domain-containing histidine kinase [Acidobacteriota bacterium]